MDPDRFVKDFVKSWARHILDLSAVKTMAQNDAKNEGAVHQQIGYLYEGSGPLATPVGIREVAFRLALAEYQVSVEHA